MSGLCREALTAGLRIAWVAACVQAGLDCAGGISDAGGLMLIYERRLICLFVSLARAY
jgi:hypothetical protein